MYQAYLDQRAIDCKRILELAPSPATEKMIEAGLFMIELNRKHETFVEQFRMRMQTLFDHPVDYAETDNFLTVFTSIAMQKATTTLLETEDISLETISREVMKELSSLIQLDVPEEFVKDVALAASRLK